MNKPELCSKAAYSITPSYQPIIKDDKYYCKFCGNEVETAVMMEVKPCWVHKTDGAYIGIDEYILYICKGCTHGCVLTTHKERSMPAACPWLTIVPKWKVLI